eukprot:11642-Heterococcus_DN1.PRE.4
MCRFRTSCACKDEQSLAKGTAAVAVHTATLSYTVLVYGKTVYATVAGCRTCVRTKRCSALSFASIHYT